LGLTKSILFLASGRGSNFQAIVDHVKLGILQNVVLKALVSNHPDANALSLARAAGIKAIDLAGAVGRKYSSPREKEEARRLFDSEWVSIAGSLGIDLVVLAGFDQMITGSVVDTLSFTILNIHPAYDLLAFGGKNMVGSKIHQRVLQSGAKYSGCTVHVVSREIDRGPPVVKRRVPVLAEDTPESLEKRILKEEHLAFPEALQLFADSRVTISKDKKKCYVDRYSDNWDLNWMGRQEAYLEFRQRTVED
jgi:phosphoribosylglycinamide formyltransferase 1